MVMPASPPGIGNIIVYWIGIFRVSDCTTTLYGNHGISGGQKYRHHPRPLL